MTNGENKDGRECFSKQNKDVSNVAVLIGIEKLKGVAFWFLLLLTPGIFCLFSGIKVSFIYSILAIINSILLLEIIVSWRLNKEIEQIKTFEEYQRFKNRHSEVERCYQLLFEQIGKDEKHTIFKEHTKSLFDDVLNLDKNCVKEEERLKKLEQIKKEMISNSSKDSANPERLAINNEILPKIEIESKAINEFVYNAMKEIDETAIDFTNLRAQIELNNDSDINEITAKIKNKSDSLRFLQNNVPTNLI